MAKYLVTGGAGFIGSHLAGQLVAHGHSVRVLDDLSSGRRENVPPDVSFIKGDVYDPDTVSGAFDGIDGCFHLAAIASVERSQRDWLRAHKVNLSGTITVLDAARRAQTGFGRTVPVVYASSAAIYGDAGISPISETTPAAPLSPYGLDKLGCEMYAAMACRIYRVHTVGLRFFNIYGPRQDPSSPYSGVVSIFLDRMRDQTPYEIHGDGNQVRDFVFVDDAVRALQLAMANVKADPQVVNVCTGAGTTVRQLGATIAALCGTEFAPQQKPSRQGDVRISLGDPQKAQQKLGFTARKSLSEGLAETLADQANAIQVGAC